MKLVGIVPIRSILQNNKNLGEILRLMGKFPLEVKKSFCIFVSCVECDSILRL